VGPKNDFEVKGIVCLLNYSYNLFIMSKGKIMNGGYLALKTRVYFYFFYFDK